MKKKAHIGWILAFLCLGLVLGGCGMNTGQSEKEKEQTEMIKIAESQKVDEAVRKLMMQEDSKAFTEKGFIKKYSINQDKLKYNPMGGLIVEIIINDDKDLTIGTTIILDEYGNAEYTGYVVSEKLVKRLRGFLD